MVEWLFLVLQIIGSLFALFIVILFAKYIFWGKGSRAFPFDDARDAADVLHLPQADPFDVAPTMQFRATDGKLRWMPTPTTQSQRLTEQYVAIGIECPKSVDKGSEMRVDVDVSNNHLMTRLVDNALLILTKPSGAQRFFGPDSIELNPHGDTSTITYLFCLPYIKGNYTIEFRLLKIGAKSERILVAR